MQSIIARTKTFLTPSHSSSSIHKSRGFSTSKSATALFPATDPKVDGEDCLYDCASCTESLPRKWEIDEEDKLYGHVKGWETHLIVATGKADWVRDVIDEKGSLMQAVGKEGLELKNGKLMLSASNLPSHDHHLSDVRRSSSVSESQDRDHDYPNGGRTRCVVLPSWQVVDGVGYKDAKWLIQEVIEKSSTNSTPLSKLNESSAPQKNTDISPARSVTTNDGEVVVQREADHDSDEAPDINGLTLTPSQQQKQRQEPVLGSTTDNNEVVTDMSNHSLTPTRYTGQIPSHITLKPCPHRAIILMCSHGTRDWRCGKSAPILKREFERHLRPLGLYREFDDERPGGVGVYFINHVGGHKYSANVMIYRREGKVRNGNNGEKEELSDEAVQGIWLARVRPEDCENIVRFTVLQGKLVKPQRQLRGGFDRERGLLSW